MRGYLLTSLLGGFLSLAVSGQTIHRVKEGESLWLIAKRAGVSVDAIREANQLTSDVIWEGADLKIPAPVAPRPKLPPRPSIPVSPESAEPPLRPLHESFKRPTSSTHSTQNPTTDSTPLAPIKPRSKEGISEKGLQILQLQVLLDRAGYSPGVLDGYDGKYTQLSRILCEAWNPAALQTQVSATRTVSVAKDWRPYVNSALPGSGKATDFKALTKKPRVLHYYSALEYFAERFHCSEALLKKLNPQTKFEKLSPGDALVVPNVEPFEIERYFNSEGKGNWKSGVGKGETERMVYISAENMTLTVWEGAKLIRSYPITLNLEDSPRGRRKLGSITPGPNYARKKTGLALLPGPNSPVGIVWCPLGNGFGIHGTSNPDSIGRATSSGCVRLANWDAVRFAELVRKGTRIEISERERNYTGGS